MYMLRLGVGGAGPPRSEFKKHSFCRHDDRHFTWFTLQPKSANEIGWSRWKIQYGASDVLDEIKKKQEYQTPWFKLAQWVTEHAVTHAHTHAHIYIYIYIYTYMGARFFAHDQTGPGAHPASCTMGTGSFPGVKRPGRGADHPPTSSAEVRKE
jgi:hypothetical protein